MSSKTANSVRNTISVNQRVTGIGQLSLVEHALCPLDQRASLAENLVYDSGYGYTDRQGNRRRAEAKVFAPLGLTVTDEFYLWGLLSLVNRRSVAGGELVATPHWILRRLGVIDSKRRRGGRQYRQFSDAVRRLSLVRYLNDAFYDPVRAEHRRVSFGFFSYSLPEDPDSSRAWRFVWDPVLFEAVQADAGHLRFDLSIYRRLDPSSRRLFLFVSKVLYRSTQLRAIPLDQLAINTIGFSDAIHARDLRMKVNRCLRCLVDEGILADASVYRTKLGNYFVRMSRGERFSYQVRRNEDLSQVDSPLIEILQTIGFDDASAARLIHRFERRPRLLTEWCDITQAALERYGPSFFKKSPMAYLIDSVDKASKGNRTPPDWWHDLRRSESRQTETTAEARRILDQIGDSLKGKSKLMRQSRQGAGPLRASDILRRQV